MYGLLLDSIQKFIRETYGERYWASIRRQAKLNNHWFVTHEVYSDSVMTDLVEAAAKELGESPSSIMKKFGEYFVQSIGHYGYARLLRVLGRDMRDFLNGLDDLHEYLRFSYPKMKPPSFFCERETPEGMLLHYTTRRKGFLNYVIGQLHTVGRIYGKELDIVEQSLEMNGDELHYVLELRFDNREMLWQKQICFPGKDFQVDCEKFLEVFPFCVVFEHDLTISQVGSKLREVLPDLIGQKLDEKFTLRKPQFGQLTWSTICSHPNCVFELVSTAPVKRHHTPLTTDIGPEITNPPPGLKLKGQMMSMGDLQCFAFLCSPAMDSPEALYENGIYINDLAKHDSSRDYILAGSQQNPELNLALHQEKIRSAQLEESAQRTDRLLYQMIPKPIADQLRNGETPLNTCREFESVSILFSDVVSFTPMCSRLRPMEVVCVLNAMCVAFDQLCDKHSVYKVETIGDGYMVICGAPDVQLMHAVFITDFAFSIIEATSKINDPSTNKSLRIRVGIHSGTVVAGVVGASILRYDVFGDSVNVAARMEATGEPMRIHVSEATAELLHNTQFVLEERGKVEVKGKGLMLTYWVRGKKEGDLPEQTAVLNPYQREIPKVRPPISVGNSPPLSPHLSPSTRHRSLISITHAGGLARGDGKRPSPEPHEWPQADRQLAARQDDRRSTMPDIVCQQCLATPTSHAHSDRRNTINTTEARELQALLQSHGLGNHDNLTQQVSELNLLNIRGSLRPITEGEHELAAFAELAEENARQARRVADWARDLARPRVRKESCVDVCRSRASSLDQSATPLIRTHPSVIPEDLSSRQPPNEHTHQDGACVTF